jgi:hypothetical protein
MTEVAIPEPHQQEPLTDLAVWANSARQAASVAVSLAKTPFVPQSLRGGTPEVTAANITAAILTGQEIGIQPMAALRSIDVIQGTPAMRAVALRALVQSAGHDVWVVEQTNTRAVVRGKRKGTDIEQTSTWTMDRAQALGLSGKDNWRKQPQAMLVARATSELCRLVAADVILGIPYSVEELEDGPAVEGAPSEPVKPRTARRRIQPVPVDMPEPDPTPDPPVSVEPDEKDLLEMAAEMTE